MSSDTAAATTGDCEPYSRSMDLAGASDVGRRRDKNQDHFLIADLQRMLTIRSSNVPHERCEQLFGNDPGQLLVVADGMGGHASGEVASTTAIEACAHYVLDMTHWFLKLSASNEHDFEDELSECLKQIQEKIWAKNNGNSQHERMGTTVTMAYIVWPRMYVVHAGDSRCYLLRKGELRQLTTDHTLAQRLVEEGALSAKDAETSRWKHVLWNCVGGGERTVSPEVTRVTLQSYDTVLVCSDGLTGMVANDQIAAILNGSESAENKVARLIDRANEAGGEDNITAIVAELGEMPGGRSGDEQHPDNEGTDTTIIT